MVQDQTETKGEAKAEQSKAEKLERLYGFYARGIITPEEYEERAKKIEKES